VASLDRRVHPVGTAGECCIGILVIVLCAVPSALGYDPCRRNEYTPMSGKPVPPSISSVAFSCPHCGAFADQFWYDTYAVAVRDHGTPFRMTAAEAAVFAKDAAIPDAARESIRESNARLVAGEVFFEHNENSQYRAPSAENLSLSLCHSCRKLSVWVHDGVVHPPVRTGIEPNEDLSADILRDFNEARSIVDASPRGAAALLRLCIQKLCIEFGEPGKDLNLDIGALVKKGLDARIQKALDVVRVVGNEAVHPGSIDLRDDRDTATKLFGLVNMIADRMITQEKHVASMYEGLPAAKLKGIVVRDKPKS